MEGLLPVPTRREFMKIMTELTLGLVKDKIKVAMKNFKKR